jgi:glycosyltransferase involved in cell wall biosynthesis
MKASAGKRVVMLLENSPYREDNRVKNEARTLVEAGYHVTVICPMDKPGQPWREMVGGVRLYQFPQTEWGSGFMSYLWEYAYSLVIIFLNTIFISISEGFDIIHTHNPPDTFVLIAGFYKLFGKKFVYDHHDLSPEMYYARFRGKGNRLVYHVLVCFEKLACRLADRVIATNESYKKVEMERSNVPEHRITVVRNGPNLNRVKLVDPDPELRAKAPTIIGFVGEMGYQDGVDYLLRAIKHLLYDLGRSDFSCVMIGQGDAWEELKQLSKDLKIDDHMWFTGRIPDADLMRYLSTADICVAPDPKNDFTNRSTMIKVMEFMTLGKPVVAFDLNEHRNSAQDAAIYATPNDEMEFARSIALLMDDPEKRRAMGEYGQERIKNSLAWPHQAKNLLRAYKAFQGEK